MGGSPLSTVKENAREQLLSSDLVRMIRLMSREVQEEMAGGSASQLGSPISSLDYALSLTGVVGGFTANIAANRGWFYDAAFPGLTSDDSPFLALRWGAQLLTFGNPNGSNPRIDLVVADPQQLDTDLQSRNILLDPVARTISPQNVYKTSGPASVLTVITGTAASTPLPPAVPAHMVAVAEVYVPALAADATAFQVAPCLWRRAAYPGSASNGPIAGCVLAWDITVDPSAASASIGLVGASKHKIAIDGEVVEWVGSSPPVATDTAANPFATAAGLTWSRPYYVYLCGGRNLPQGYANAGTFYPIILMESTTPPDSDGHPTASIITPRGATKLGAVYVGLGFVFRNTTHRQPLIMAGEWTFGRDELEVLLSATSPATLTSCPATALFGAVEMGVALTANGPQTLISIGMDALGAPGTGGATGYVIEELGGSSSSALLFRRVVRLPITTPLFQFVVTNAIAPNFQVQGYQHNVQRLRG